MDPDVLGMMLEERGFSDDEIDNALAHAGVKGMKWGVRRQRRLDTLNRVASGQGSVVDKAKVALGSSVPSLIKGGGSLQKTAANRAKGQTARKVRIQEGRATAIDLLAQVGTVRLFDLGPLDR